MSETSTSSRKEVVTLSSMLEVNKVEVEKLREELEKQSRSHSLRIAELQESFQNKIIIINRKCLSEPLAKITPRRGSRTRLFASGNAFQSLWPRVPSGKAPE